MCNANKHIDIVAPESLVRDVGAVEPVILLFRSPTNQPDPSIIRKTTLLINVLFHIGADEIVVKD